MKRLLGFLVIGLFSCSSVLAGPKDIGICLGYLSTKFHKEGQILPGQMEWVQSHMSELKIAQKIGNEQSNCIMPGQTYDHCLTSYSKYEQELYIGTNTGGVAYDSIVYEIESTRKAKEALILTSCL